MPTRKNDPVTIEALRDSTAELAAWRGKLLARAAAKQTDTTLARMQRRRDDWLARHPEPGSSDEDR